MLGLGNGGVNWAEQYVPSGLSAVIIATVPFFMLGVDRLFPDGERITRESVLGLLVGTWSLDALSARPGSRWEMLGAVSR